MTSVVDNALDEDYVEIERRLKIAQVRLYACIVHSRGSVNGKQQQRKHPTTV